MRYHALPLRPMQESGAFLLRAMQNEDMPRLDLLVRESVQNALDAALDKQPGGEVRISFHVREHATQTISSLLSEGIDRKVLAERHPDGGQLLEIRDSLTEGLTGPLSFEDIGADGVHGNLLKLVYEIGRTRSDTGAGGSWGLGKTCYFQMGLGLVFYYSRIKVGDDYQERLVASLVEDETRPDRLQRDTRTGIGWWGADSALKPLTHTTQIRRALEDLRVKPFTAAQTGTVIIIPFLRDDLVPAAETGDDGRPISRPWWYESYESYIRIALERWFCARLDNRHFAMGPRLTASVNDETIEGSKMLPVFRVAQALYNRASGVPIADDDYLAQISVAPDAFMQKPVATRSLFVPTGPAGDVAAVLLTPEQLGMGAPSNQYDPGLCVFGRSDANPPYRPLVTFMRRPGMCVCWDDSTESRGWAGGLPGLVDGRYLVAVFVPNLTRILAAAGRRPSGAAQLTLESYLRSCERADHAAWHDAAGLNVVEKIRLGCGRILRDFGSTKPPAATVAPSMRMARNLADLLLPERGMGSDGRNGRSAPRRGSSGSPYGSGSRRSIPATPVLELLDIAYTARGIELRWSLCWGSAEPHVSRKISLSVDSESGPITLQQWSEDGLGAFPFQLLDAMLERKDGDSAARQVEIRSDGESELLLHVAADGPIDTVTGVLCIARAAGGAGALRPVLAAALAVTNMGHA